MHSLYVPRGNVRNHGPIPRLGLIAVDEVVYRQDRLAVRSWLVRRDDIRAES